MSSLVCCLTVDLFGSTGYGLELSGVAADDFNRALIQQVEPHIERLGLQPALIKFTGDGWMISTPDANLFAGQACLALIMTQRFQTEVGTQLGVAVAAIPAVRAALAIGVDTSAILGSGQAEWVGHSARRSVRLSQLCQPNEVLVHDAHAAALTDFVMEQVTPRTEPPKWEEPLRFLRLIGLRDQAIADAHRVTALSYFVSLPEDADPAIAAVNALVVSLEEHPPTTAPEFAAAAAEVDRTAALLNDFRKLHYLTQGARVARVPLGKEHVRRLIELSPDESNAREAALLYSDPDPAILAALISKIESFDVVKRYVNTYAESGGELDLAVYKALLRRVPNVQGASELYLAMEENGVLIDDEADELLRGHGLQ